MISRTARWARSILVASMLAGVTGCELYRQCDEGAVECFGVGHGRQCSGGRWYEFYDGPCLITDTGTARDDAGSDTGDADASAMDAGEP